MFEQFNLVLEEQENEFVVEGRELHQALKLKTQYSKWIKRAIDRCQLVTGKDFIVSVKNGRNPKGGRPEIEYLFTIKSAKEICMVSKGDLPKKIRRYIIEVEEGKTPPLKKQNLSKAEACLETINSAELLLENAKKLYQLQLNQDAIEEQLERNEEKLDKKKRLS